MFALNIITTFLCTLVAIIFAYVTFTIRFVSDEESGEEKTEEQNNDYGGTVEFMRCAAFLGALSQILAIFLIWA